MPTVTCAGCGKEFHKKPSRVERSEKHYCSFECRKKTRYFVCEWCGETVQATGGGQGRDNQRFCSRACANRAHNEKRRNRVTTSCSYCGAEIERQVSRLNYCTAHFCSLECKDKYHSDAMSGSGNPRWNGGHTDYRGSDWYSVQRAARERDGYVCRGCGMSNDDCLKEFGGSLQVHHIVPYSATKDNGLVNLVSLCNRCHSKVETGVMACPS